MRKRCCRMALALLSLCCSSITFATPVSFLSFRELAEQSAVIVGAVVQPSISAERTSVNVAGKSIGAMIVTSALQVKDVIKGDQVPADLMLETLAFDNHTIPQDGPVKGEYRVYFLERRADGRYVPTNPVQLSFPAAPYGGKPAPYVSERVADFVGAVLTQPNASRRMRQEAIEVLGDSDEPHASIPLRSALGDPDQRVRLRVATMMVRLGDEKALPIAEDLLSHPQESTAAQADELRAALRGLREDQITPAFVSSCTRLSESSDPDTRRVALLTLAHSRSPAAIATLAKALVAGDREGQLAAERGLQLITGQRPPNEVVRAKDAQAISAFWINWARTQGLIK